MIEKVVSLGGVYVGTANASKRLRPLVEAILETRKISTSPSASTRVISNATVAILPPAPEDSLTIISMKLGQPPQPDRNIWLDNLPQPLRNAADNIIALREAGLSPELTGRLTEVLPRVLEALG